MSCPDCSCFVSERGFSFVLNVSQHSISISVSINLFPPFSGELYSSSIYLVYWWKGCLTGGSSHLWVSHRWDEMKMGWDNNEEYCCCSGDIPLGPQSQRLRLFLSFDVRLQLSGFHCSAQPQVKNLQSLKCWKKVLFVVLNHVGIFLPGSLRRFRCYSVSPEQEKDRN